MTFRREKCVQASFVSLVILSLVTPFDAAARGSLGGGRSSGRESGRQDDGGRAEQGSFIGVERRSSGVNDTGLGTNRDEAFGIVRNAAAARRPNQTYSVTPADLATSAGDINSNFKQWSCFDRHWRTVHRDAWNYDQNCADEWCWDSVAWSDLASYWDVPGDSTPTSYDYGNNITYQGDTVYYGSKPLESATVYYQQAQSLALSELPASAATQANQWRSLGVFALSTNGQSDPSQLFQLAVNKQGIIRGNYYNASNDQTKQVSGAADKKNMRVCWIVAGNKNVVYDTGLGNLFGAAGPVLVHYGKSALRQYVLVRLKNPNMQMAPKS